MSVLCLTGWQQPKDALAEIAPDAEHFDYASYDTKETMFAALPPHCDLAIGWSLGGQLLVHAIAKGHMKATTLLLLGAPFQFMADGEFAHGVTSEMFHEIMINYKSNAKEMLPQFNHFIGLGDSKGNEIARTLNRKTAIWQNGAFWLEELGKASGHGLDYSDFPKTIIVHGAKDKVIVPENAKAYGELIPDTEMHIWQECAHAPHLHNPEAIRELIENYV